MTLSSYQLGEAHRLHRGPLSNMGIDLPIVLKARSECYAGAEMKMSSITSITENRQHQHRSQPAALDTTAALSIQPYRWSPRPQPYVNTHLEV